jgi:cytochrome P450
MEEADGLHGVSNYDPFSDDTLTDPFPAYARLRAQCPVHHQGGFTPPFFTLSRYDDVVDALRDVDHFSMRYGPSPQYTRPSGLVSDPPEHTEFRRLFIRGFTPRTVHGIEAEIEGLATKFLEDMASFPSGDFHSIYAYRLPMTVIARLVGVPEADLHLFKRLCDDLTATYNSPDPVESAAARSAIDGYVQIHIDERRRLLAEAGVVNADESHLGTVLPNDLVSGFVVAEVDGRRLTDHEMQWMLLLLLLGGVETSTALHTNLVWRLLEDRTRWERLLADPSLIDVAVEESLRCDPPVLGLFRTTTTDMSLHDVHMPAKAKVMVCYASANHDESVFTDPETFSLDRPAAELSQHLAFGFGAHFCPGAALARAEARISLRLLLQRFPRLRLDGEPTRIAAFNLWGRASLPLRWD